HMTAAIVGIVSALIMYGVYLFNKKLATKVNSPGLLAAAKDNLSDAWTSIGTAVAVFAA
ncbi:MAG TPA: transporter, partial [Enterococcus sp.]|nr:transporter [Enterococcus sp.]